MINWLRRSLLHLLRPFALEVGSQAAVARETISAHDCLSIVTALQPGDVILTKTYHRLTNWLIPGHYKHSLMYVGEGTCVEAVIPLIKATDILEVIQRVDELAIMRGRGLNSKLKLTKQIVANMNGMIGSKYDLDFEPGNKAFYCSEAVFFAISDAIPKWGFTERERLGVQTVIPQDIRDADKFFSLVWESKRKS